MREEATTTSSKAAAQQRTTEIKDDELEEYQIHHIRQAIIAAARLSNVVLDYKSFNSVGVSDYDCICH